MLAYAATRRRLAERRPAPHAMLFILVAHIAAIAMVMSARMDLPPPIKRTVTEVDMIPLPKPRPPEPRASNPQPRTSPSVVDRMPVVIPVPQPDVPPLDATPIPLPPAGDIVGPRVEPKTEPQPIPDPVRVGPRFATPPSAVRPPYPPSKIVSGEEAVLRLRLTIDARGRVIAVEPVGRADPAFLEAARRHLTARWRYKPATEGGRAVASSTVITLRFRLED